jgi:hypothetical protein
MKLKEINFNVVKLFVLEGALKKEALESKKMPQEAKEYVLKFVTLFFVTLTVITFILKSIYFSIFFALIGMLINLFYYLSTIYLTVIDITYYRDAKKLIIETTKDVFDYYIEEINPIKFKLDGEFLLIEDETFFVKSSKERKMFYNYLKSEMKKG